MPTYNIDGSETQCLMCGNLPCTCSPLVTADNSHHMNFGSPKWNTAIHPDDLVYDPESGAMKADGSKLRYDLIPAKPLEDLAKVLTYGSLKYEERNWEKGMKWSRPFAACMRHLWAWWSGEDTDPDTGISHLAHAACNLFFLMEFRHTAKDYDDRP